MHESFHILIIDPDQEDVSGIQQALESFRSDTVDFTMEIAATLEEGAHLLKDHEKKFDLIICDLHLTDSDGLATVNVLIETSPSTPIVMTSPSPDDAMLREATRMGIQDYLPNDELDPKHLHRVVYGAIERGRFRQSLKALSFTDEMTGVYNRRGVVTLLEQQIQLAQRTNRGFYLFIVDLDYLKMINDTYGHRAGDRALMDVAECLELAFRHHDIIGRIGGDEFAVIAINASEDSLEHILHKIAYKFQEHNALSKEPYELSISIGSVYFNGKNGMTIEELFQSADQALYVNKKTAHSGKIGPSRE